MVRSNTYYIVDFNMRHREGAKYINYRKTNIVLPESRVCIMWHIVFFQGVYYVISS